MNGANEAHTLVYVILDALGAIILVGLIATIFALNTDVWRVAENQEYSAQVMQEYANYAAYNDTEIRGQELVNLLKGTAGDPFVIVLDDNLLPILFSYNSTYFPTMDATAFTSYSSDVAVQNAFNYFLATYPDPVAWSAIGSDKCVDFSAVNPTADQLQELFLNRGPDNASFRTYHTTLIYGGSTDNTVIGILALEVF